MMCPLPAMWFGLRRRWRAAAQRRRTRRLLAKVAAEPVTKPLLAATREGDTVAVGHLLDQGEAPSVTGAAGWTALHEAVARGHLETAALLLVRGADYTRAEDRGYTPFGTDFADEETLHAIRQRYHRARPPMPETPPHHGEAASWAADLERYGIVKTAGLVPPEALKRLREDFGAFVASLDAKIAQGTADFRHYDEEEHWWPADRAYVSNNAFKYSRELIRLCCRPDILEAVSLYVGKSFLIQRGIAMRYLPSKTTTRDMFGWHHDMEEKRFKVMILLSDVGEHDQYMSYVVGSHRLFHPYAMFFQNTCSLRYCRQHLPQIEIYKALGTAGDAFFFDSNGAHRGNRSETARVRDVFLIEYSADRTNLWGGDIDPDIFKDIPIIQGNPFRHMLAVEKKWMLPVTRRSPTWPESLPHIDQWHEENA